MSRRAAGELAVVGVLLEDECPPASSGRCRQQWCSALQQAMDAMPKEAGKESSALYVLLFIACVPANQQQRMITANDTRCA
jgi:hypothetical protein